MINTEKPLLILDQHFRRLEELFSAESFDELRYLCSVVGGYNRPMERSLILEHLPKASFFVASHPVLSFQDLLKAQKLSAVIEVSGTFQTGLDYNYCFENGIDVLSCAPGFQYSVAEMTLGLMLSGARGIVNEHENFRSGTESWLNDNEEHDFTLYGQNIGFIGYGAIAQETARLMAGFNPKIKAFDPWLAASGQSYQDVTFCDVSDVVASSRCLVIAASPTDENYQLIDRQMIKKMLPGTLVIVISRSHLVEFDALIEAADSGRIRVATDVFPTEPVAQESSMRQARNTILSPHRAAAVVGGRHPIGRMIVNDISNILSGDPNRQLQRATPERIGHIIRAPDVAAAGG